MSASPCSRGGPVTSPLPLAALSGLADVDAVILNVTRMPPPPPGFAAGAILIAALANMLSKSVLAFAGGSVRFGIYFTGASLAVICMGAAVFTLAGR